MGIEKEADISNLHITGKVVKTGNNGFAGASSILGKKLQRNLLPVDVNDFTAIEFDARGNDETYAVVLHSSLVEDYSYHSVTFKTSKEWQTIRIPFNEFRQNPYFGKQMELDTKTIQAITFLASGKDYDIDLWLKNIRLVK